MPAPPAGPRPRELPSHASGASSAVSELDEADREVGSLTARAFRSLAFPRFEALRVCSRESTLSALSTLSASGGRSALLDLKRGPGPGAGAGPGPGAAGAPRAQSRRALDFVVSKVHGELQHVDAAADAPRRASRASCLLKTVLARSMRLERELRGGRGPGAAGGAGGGRSPDPRPDERPGLARSRRSAFRSWTQPEPEPEPEPGPPPPEPEPQPRPTLLSRLFVPGPQRPAPAPRPGPQAAKCPAPAPAPAPHAAGRSPPAAQPARCSPPAPRPAKSSAPAPQAPAAAPGFDIAQLLTPRLAGGARGDDARPPRDRAPHFQVRDVRDKARAAGPRHQVRDVRKLLRGPDADRPGDKAADRDRAADGAPEPPAAPGTVLVHRASGRLPVATIAPNKAERGRFLPVLRLGAAPAALSPPARPRDDAGQPAGQPGQPAGQAAGAGALQRLTAAVRSMEQRLRLGPDAAAPPVDPAPGPQPPPARPPGLQRRHSNPGAAAAPAPPEGLARARPRSLCLPPAPPRAKAEPPAPAPAPPAARGQAPAWSGPAAPARGAPASADPTPGLLCLAPPGLAAAGPAQTQRRVLLDVGSGQYYVVDAPLRPPARRLFDPETGQYVDVPLPAPSALAPLSPLTPLAPLAPLSPVALGPGFAPAYLLCPGLLPAAPEPAPDAPAGLLPLRLVAPPAFEGLGYTEPR